MAWRLYTGIYPINDTNEIMAGKMRELMSKKSPEERFEMGCSMFMTAKAFVKASLEQKGSLPAPVLQQQFFMRFYGNDFTKLKCDKILKHLASQGE